MTKVFISYVSENEELAKKLKLSLEKYGIKVWFDKESIPVGSRWELEIRKGITNGDFFIACFSKEYSMRLKTYMNEELTIAIEELRQRVWDQSWFLPVLINQTEIPVMPIRRGEDLSSIQALKLYEDWDGGINKLVQAIGGTDQLMQDIEYPNLFRIMYPLEMHFLRIPAGEFLMGDDKDQHMVYLDEYFFGQTPVSDAQYSVFENLTFHKYTSRSKIPESSQPYGISADTAQRNINWFNALLYCQWLSDQTGLQVTLPSEAEWEKAVRGSESLIYPSDNDETKSSHIFRNTFGKFTPVGDSHSTSKDRIYLPGMIHEWTRSLAMDYPYDPNDGRESLSEAGNRIARGCESDYMHTWTYLPFRYKLNPSNTHDICFRVVIHK